MKTALLALAIIGLGAALYGNKKFQEVSSQSAIEQSAHESVLPLLKDPYAAQFQHLRNGSSKAIVCGEVNGRNSFGGYTGFKKFYVLNGKAKLEDELNRRDFERLYSIICSPPA